MALLYFRGGVVFALFFSGMRSTDSAVTVTLSLGEPVGAAFWSVLLLNEILSF